MKDIQSMVKTLLVAVGGLFGLCVDADVIVYSQNFSSAPPIVTHGVGGDFQVGGGSDPTTQTVSGSYSYNTLRTNNNAVDPDPVNNQAGGTGVSAGVLSLRYNNQGVLWLLLDTSSWSTGDYTLTFDAINYDRSGNLIYYDVFGGSGLDAFDGTSNGDYLEIRTASAPPQIAVRNLLGGATSEALDPARTILDGASDNEITSVANSISFSLTTNHVGTAGDYFLVGWGNSSGDDWELDNVEISMSVVPEPSSLLLLGIGLVALVGFRRFNA